MLGTSGCGGGEPENAGRLVLALGFQFVAPPDWQVKREDRGASATDGKDASVGVTVLTLRRAYRPELFPRVTKELDRVAGELAHGLGGRVSASRTVIVAGLRSRQYDVVHGTVAERLTFVLRGKSEYQLTCRWTAKQPPAACAQLLATFSFR